jgi:hypothetical protein
MDFAFSLIIGISFIAATYFKQTRPHEAFIPYLWIVPLLFMTPFLVSKWINMIKGRESAAQAITFSVALILFYSVYYLPPYPALGAVLVGLCFIIVFFYKVSRYPSLNSSWAVRLIEETAQKVTQQGRYSAKPVIIQIPMERRFITGITGLSILVKKDHAVCWISKKLHQKYGSPNLEEFFTLLCKSILNEPVS